MPYTSRALAPSACKTGCGESHPQASVEGTAGRRFGAGLSHLAAQIPIQSLVSCCAVSGTGPAGGTQGSSGSWAERIVMTSRRQLEQSTKLLIQRARQAWALRRRSTLRCGLGCRKSPGLTRGGWGLGPRPRLRHHCWPTEGAAAPAPAAAAEAAAPTPPPLRGVVGRPGASKKNCRRRAAQLPHQARAGGSTGRAGLAPGPGRTLRQEKVPSALRHLLCATSKMPTSLGVEQISAGSGKEGGSVLPIVAPRLGARSAGAAGAAGPRVRPPGPGTPHPTPTREGVLPREGGVRCGFMCVYRGGPLGLRAL